MKKTPIILIVLSSFFLTNCTVIRPGQVGVKQRLGKLNDKVYREGIVGYNPFIAKVIKASTQTNNLKLVLTYQVKKVSVSPQEFQYCIEYNQTVSRLC